MKNKKENISELGNWYFYYDKQGYDESSIDELSKIIESYGYKYHQCTGLGGGPGIEQIIIRIHNNQFISGVSIGVLSNYVYDVLKNIFKWITTHKRNNKNIPTVEIILHFKDIKIDRVVAKLKFRVDKLPQKEELKTMLNCQTKYLYATSKGGIFCSICKRDILKYIVYYLEKNEQKPICQSCMYKLVD